MRNSFITFQNECLIPFVTTKKLTKIMMILVSFGLGNYKRAFNSFDNSSKPGLPNNANMLRL